jgi:hypothetical protein
MNDFRKRLEQLENEVSDRYTELSNLKSEYIFIAEEDIEECDKSFEVRDEINGGVYDVNIIKIDDNGIFVCNYNDTDHKYYISFWNIADVSDRIALIDLMEEQLKK